MLNSPKQRWPFPDEGQDPWFEAFQAMVNAMDASAFAAREDRHLVLMAGGTLQFSAASGVLSWSSAIEILAAVTGFKWSIPAGSLALSDGDIVYVNLVRGPTSNVNVVAVKGTQVPSSDAACFVCIRRGDRVYWRDGQILETDLAAPVLSSNSSFFTLETTTSALTGTSFNPGITIPINSTVFYVTTRVQSTITGPAAWRIGIVGDTNRYGGNLTLPLGTTNQGVDSSGFVRQYAAATTLRITPEDGVTAFTGGTVRIVIHYMLVATPTS